MASPSIPIRLALPEPREAGKWRHCPSVPTGRRCNTVAATPQLGAITAVKHAERQLCEACVRVGEAWPYVFCDATGS
jgi:hypothetical protein